MRKTRISFDEGKTLAHLLIDTEGDVQASILKAEEQGIDLSAWVPGGISIERNGSIIATRTVAVDGQYLVIWDDYLIDWVDTQSVEIGDREQEPDVEHQKTQK